MATKSRAYIYSLIEEKRIHEMLDAFYNTVGLSIQLLDESGSILDSCGKQFSYCRNFVSHLSAKNTCANIHGTAAQRAMNLGEAYIFSCHSGLNHIAFPFINRGTLFGSILVGPFLMSEPDSTIIMEIAKNYSDFSAGDLLNLYDDSKELPVVEPEKVTHISHLLYFLFSSVLSNSQELFEINQKKIHQQARISEAISRYKNHELEIDDEYPIEKEQELLAKVKSGDLNSSREILNELLGYLYVTAGRDMDLVKYRSMEISSLLSRATMESGAPSNQILKINNEFIKNINTFKNIDDFCYALSDILTTFIECMFPVGQGNNSFYIREAMEYITKNFSKELNLSEVASHVHLNPTYFSRVFKQVSGSSFKEYITSIRVEESKRLLKNTNYSLMDIAIATGFENQSYFSRVFKKYTGLTPKQYRD